VARSLRAACASGGVDRLAREDLSLASLFSGMALANAGLGAVHGFAGPIGGLFPAPHGAVCAALLPHVLGGNLRVLETREPGHPALPRFHVVARWLTGRTTASAADGIDWLHALVRDLGVPTLGAYGLTAADVPAIAVQASRSSSMKGNPVALEPEDMAGMLTAAL
jgi:alcohol dehydrogenase class IV